MNESFSSTNPWNRESLCSLTDASYVSDFGDSTKNSQGSYERTNTSPRPVWKTEENKKRVTNDSSDDRHSSLYRTCANSPDDFGTEYMNTVDPSVNRVIRAYSPKQRASSSPKYPRRDSAKHSRQSSGNFILSNNKRHSKKRQWICVQPTSPLELPDEDNPLLKKKQTYENALKAYRLARVMNSYRPDRHDRMRKGENAKDFKSKKSHRSWISNDESVDTQSSDGQTDSKRINGNMISSKNNQFNESESYSDSRAGKKSRKMHLCWEKRQKRCYCNQDYPQKSQNNSTLCDAENTRRLAKVDCKSCNYEETSGWSHHFDHSSIRKWVDDVTKSNCLCRKYNGPSHETNDSRRRRRRKKARPCNARFDKDSDTDSFDYPGKSEVGTESTTAKSIRKLHPNRAKIHVFEGGLRHKKRNFVWELRNESSNRSKCRNERKYKHVEGGYKHKVRDCCTQISNDTKISKKRSSGKSAEMFCDKSLQIGSPLPSFKLSRQTACGCETSGTSVVVSRTTMTSQPCHCYRSYTNTCSSRKPRKARPRQQDPTEEQLARNKNITKGIPFLDSRETSKTMLEADDSHTIHISLRPALRNSPLLEEELSISTCGGQSSCTCATLSRSICACNSQQIVGNPCVQQSLRGKINEIVSQTRSLQKTAEDIQHQQELGESCPDTMVFRCSNGNSNVTARLVPADISLTAGSRNFVKNAATLYDYYIRQPLCGRCRYFM